MSLNRTEVQNKNTRNLVDFDEDPVDDFETTLEDIHEENIV